jgi:hypothetical protein
MFEEDQPKPLYKKGEEPPPTKREYEEALQTPIPSYIPVEEQIARRVINETKSLNDIGSRYDHYSELLVIWEEYVQMMAKRTFLGRIELTKKMGIELAITQLRKTVAAMRGYEDQVGAVEALVDGVSRSAKHIYGGRGSALSSKGLEEMG